MISLVTIATPTAGGAKSTNATDAIVFSVPGAPRGKARPQARAFMGKVQRFKDSKTVAYESLVGAAKSATGLAPALNWCQGCRGGGRGLGEVPRGGFTVGNCGIAGGGVVYF